MLLRISTAAAVLICLFTAFLYTRASDEQIPQKATVVLTIWDSNSAITRAEARDTIVAAARSHGVSFIKSDSPTVGTGDRTFTIVNRGPSSPPIGDYRDFSRALHTHVRSDALPLNHLSGMYISTDTPASVDQVAADLQRSGLEVSTLRTSPTRMLTWAAVTTPTLPLVLAGCLLIVLGAAFWTLSIRRPDSIEQVNGRSALGLQVDHALHSLGLCACLGAIGLICSVPVLAMYNGLAQWSRFAGNAAVGCVLIAALLVVTSAVTGLIVARTRPPAAIAGQVQSRIPPIGVVALHTVALSLLMSIAISTVVTGSEVARTDTERDDWSRTSGWLAMSFTSNLDELDSAETTFADVIREQQSAGHVMLVVHPYRPYEGLGPSNGNALVVNARYLRERCVQLRTGTCTAAGSLNQTRLTLLVPTGVDDVSAVEREWDRWARFQRSNLSEDPDVLAHSGIRIDVIRTQPEQHVFNYGAARGDSTSSQDDPVIAVLPKSPAFLSDNWLTASATTAEVLFDDERSVRAALDAAGLGLQVSQLDRVRTVARNQLLTQEQAVRDTISTGALSGFVVVVAAVLLAGAQARRSRRIDFTRWTHGAGRPWGFVVAVVLTNSFAVVLFTATAPFVPWLVPTDPRAIAVAGAVALADLAVVALSLGWHRRRVRLDTIRRS